MKKTAYLKAVFFDYNSKIYLVKQYLYDKKKQGNKINFA